MKKILALVLAAVMVMALCGVAFASSTITVSDTNTATVIDGKTFTAYKLFDAVYSGSNVAYTMATDSYFYTTAAVKTILENYFTFTAIPGDTSKVVVEKKGTWTDARALADALQPYLASVPAALVAEATAVSESVDITVAGPGYYLITGAVDPADPVAGEDPVVSAVMATSVDSSVTIHPKADVPTLTKTISSPDTLDAAGKQAMAQVGTEVEFTLTSKVPDIHGYESYIYIMHDSWTSGLTYKTGSVAVTIDGDSYTGGSFVLADDGKSFTYTIPQSGLTPTGADIVLTYKAIVNDDALTTDFERNTAYLEYSNNPYDEDEKNTTPPDHVWVIDLNIDVDKVDEAGAPLPNASFKLYKVVSGANKWYTWDATNEAVVWVDDIDDADEYSTDNDGNLTTQFQGLTVGTYYLRETAAPTGYNILTTDPEIVIAATSTDASTVTISSTGNTVTNGTVTLSAGDPTDAQPVVDVEVENKTGIELPSTGGIGTTIFYVSGLIMVLGASIILISRRRADAE